MADKIATNNDLKTKAGLSNLPTGLYDSSETNAGNRCPTKERIVTKWIGNGKLEWRSLDNGNNASTLYDSNLLVRLRDLIKKTNYKIQVAFKTVYNRFFVKTLFYMFCDETLNLEAYLKQYYFVPMIPSGDNDAPLTNHHHMLTIKEGDDNRFEEAVDLLLNLQVEGFTSYYNMYDKLNSGTAIPKTGYYINTGLQGYSFTSKYVIAVVYRGWYGRMPGVLTHTDLEAFNTNPTGFVYSAPAIITLSEDENNRFKAIGSNDPCKFLTQINRWSKIKEYMRAVYVSGVTQNGTNTYSRAANNKTYEVNIEENNGSYSISTLNMVSYENDFKNMRLSNVLTDNHILESGWKNARCSEMYYTLLRWYGLKPNVYHRIVKDSGNQNFEDINKVMLFLNGGGYVSDVKIRITYEDSTGVESEYRTGDLYTIDICADILYDDLHDNYNIGSTTVDNSVGIVDYRYDLKDFLAPLCLGNDNHYSYIAHTSQYARIRKVEVDYKYKGNNFTFSSAYEGDRLIRYLGGGYSLIYDDPFFEIPEQGIPLYNYQFESHIEFGLPPFENKYLMINQTGYQITIVINSNTTVYLFGNNVNSGMLFGSLTHDSSRQYFHYLRGSGATTEIKAIVRTEAGNYPSNFNTINNIYILVGNYRGTPKDANGNGVASITAFSNLIDRIFIYDSDNKMVGYSMLLNIRDSNECSFKNISMDTFFTAIDEVDENINDYVISFRILN